MSCHLVRHKSASGPHQGPQELYQTGTFGLLCVHANSADMFLTLSIYASEMTHHTGPVHIGGRR